MMERTARRNSLVCWDDLYHRLRREYIRMQDDGGHAGTQKFYRTKKELEAVRLLILNQLL